MEWKVPPKIKAYEALGCIGDKRIETDNNEAKVFSSSRNKFYTVRYNPEKKEIMSNDNGSYWIGYLGYPSIAFLMLKSIITYNEKFSNALSNINWKDINVKFKNDFSKTEKYVLDIIQKRGYSKEELLEEIDNIYLQIKSLQLKHFGEKEKPPTGY